MKKLKAKVESLFHVLRATALASKHNQMSQRAQLDSSSEADGQSEESTDILASEAFESKQELVKETGMCPREYFRAILEAHDGQLSQQELGDHTGWPSSTVSCLLGRMDDQGEIVRIRLGREKFVYLPEAVPEVKETDHGNHRGSTFDRLEEA